MAVSRLRTKQDAHAWLRLRASWIVVLAVLSLTACSLLIDADRDQCAIDRDCTRIGSGLSCDRGVCVEAKASGVRGEPAATGDACDGGMCMAEEVSDASVQSPNTCEGGLRCSGDETCFRDQCLVTEEIERFLCPAQEPSEDERVHFSMAVREFVSQLAPMGMKVSACRVNDVTCADPVARLDDTEGTGQIELDLPRGFDGFLEVRSEDALTALWYFTLPLDQPRVAKDLGVVAPSTLDLLAAIAGYDTDPSRGLIVLETFDCMKRAVGGVHFEAPKSGGVPFFIVDGSPSDDSTVTVRDEAANEAIGGFLNAKPGFTIFIARLGVDGPSIGQFNGYVRANTVTYLDIYP